MENLAPPVHPRHTAGAPANFDFAEEAKPAIALPNPAARETADARRTGSAETAGAGGAGPAAAHQGHAAGHRPGTAG